MLLCGNVFAQETIIINAGLDSGKFKNYTGFLHGITNLDANPIGLDLVMKLEPNHWRNANWNNTQNLADSLNISTTLVISDFYSDFKGGYANAKPWLDWAEYESFVDTLMDISISSGIAPQYWDIWNEPENSMFWTGTLNQLIECFIRTRNVVSAIDPSIKLVGPSLGQYSAIFLEFVLDSLAVNGVFLDGVSWHEFGLPDSMGSHVSDFKNKILMNPQWGNPEIHINEYSASTTQQIPAYRLGWLYHFEKSNIQWANTACWDNHFDGNTLWSGCTYGLNGLLWYDEQSPLPVYWVQRAYAEMISGDRLFCDHSDEKTLALSCKFDSLQEMRILVGRYYSIYNGQYLPTDIGKDSSDVIITVNNYPFNSNGTIPLVIERIPKGDSIFQNSPLFSPTTVFSGTTSVSSGTISITINGFMDGDVYYIYLNSQNTLSAENNAFSDNDLSVYPNPFSFSTTLQTDRYLQDASLVLYNSLGEQVKRIQNLSGQSIDLYRDNSPSGIYLILLMQDNKIIERGKLIIVD